MPGTGGWISVGPKRVCPICDEAYERHIDEALGAHVRRAWAEVGA